LLVEGKDASNVLSSGSPEVLFPKYIDHGYTKKV
jgi:hypothetical protein